MVETKKLGRIRVAGMALIVAALLAAATGAYAALTSPLIVPDNGTGTATLPAGSYIGRWHIGLGPLQRMKIFIRHFIFGQIVVETGGVLGGTIETFDSVVEVQIRDNDGFRQDIPVRALGEVHTAPRKAGEPIQSFDARMVRLEGALDGASGDGGAFEYFRLVAGDANGYPSPGHTTLYDQGNGTYKVDSSFNVRFRIDYKGAAGGPFEGLAGSVEDMVTMTAYSAESTN